MSTALKTTVNRIAIDDPSDTSRLSRLIETGAIDPNAVVAIFGKTEGNGCVNDFTRGYATQSLRRLFTEYVGAEATAGIAMVMSGGTEGVLSPHLTVISRQLRRQAKASDAQALTVGVARTGTIAPADLGRRPQIESVASSVQRAMTDARIENAADVHYVQVKCPLLSGPAIAAAQVSGKQAITDDTYKSMSYSRGASALGVALALGEIEDTTLADKPVLQDMTRFSRVASASAGSELDYCEIIVLGNSAKAVGDHTIRHAVMQDAIDIDAVREAVTPPSADKRVIQVFAKAEADPSGSIRGRRHTMLDDSDINHTRHARAVVGGVIAATVRDPMIYVSGGAEHQGPPGGGVIAAIFARA